MSPPSDVPAADDAVPTFSGAEGVLDVDAEGIIGKADAGVCEILGYADAELTGKPLSVYFCEPAIAEALLRRRADGAQPTPHAEALLLRRDGSTLLVDITPGISPREPVITTLVVRESPLNLSILDDIIGDDPASKTEILVNFVKRSGAIVDEMIAAGSAATETVRMGAHKLRSSARNIGAGPLSTLCAKLETAARQSDLAALASLLPALPRHFAEVSARVGSPATVAKQPSDNGRAVSELCVAIVDDEHFIRDLIERILRKLGVAQVECHESAESFLTGGKQADIVICDLNMPGMDGVTFLRNLASHHFPGSVILLSGEDERLLHAAEELAIASRLRVLGSLRKPVTPAMIGPLLALAANVPAQNPVDRNSPAPYTKRELEEAIDADVLEVWFQPKVCADTGELSGAEALVRWRHPVYGLIPPASFVNLAEESGLIDKLTWLVLRKSLLIAGRWHVARPRLTVAVNLSVDTLSRPGLPETIASLAESAGMPLPNLILEITESRLLRDVCGALETLSRLRLKGAGLSIDDFGTGHSSLQQLRRIPFTEMKIDRMFVHGAAADTTSRLILESSTALGKKLGMSIVAEGVEQREDLEVARAAGVDSIQGFIVSPPVPPEEFERRFIAPGCVALL